MKGVFITGTDTGVGKTVVTAGLVGAMGKKDMKVGVMKPVQSGGIVSNGMIISEDIELLLEASGLDLPRELVNPYCFVPPISPDLAAGRTEVSLELIKRRLIRLSSLSDCVFVEGAGGIASPLIKNKTNGDVARELGLPVIIISPQRLGTINHTVLTVEYLRKKDVRTIGVILNNYTEPGGDSYEDIIRQSNGEQIQTYGKVRVLGEVPYIVTPMDGGGLGEMIRTVSECIDIEYIRERI